MSAVSVEYFYLRSLRVLRLLSIYLHTFWVACISCVQNTQKPCVACVACVALVNWALGLTRLVQTSRIIARKASVLHATGRYRSSLTNIARMAIADRVRGGCGESAMSDPWVSMAGCCASRLRLVPECERPKALIR